MAFRGTYDHSLDAKNRLTVPSKFRAELAGGVVLAKGIEPCVTLWTPEGYDAWVALALRDVHPLSPQGRKLTRYFNASSFETELDGAGRVGIPRELLAHAGLTKECKLAGAHKCLEIWDRAGWERHDTELSQEMQELTAVFGGAPS